MLTKLNKNKKLFLIQSTLFITNLVRRRAFLLDNTKSRHKLQKDQGTLLEMKTRSKIFISEDEKPILQREEQTNR